MSRYKAAFYHMGISVIVFSLLGYLVLYYWYPGFFFHIEGGFDGTRIIMGVDLVLGPLLTLIVFKAGKPGLKLDLAMIGSLQTICLLAGIYIVYSERPLAFIHYEGDFYTASTDTYTDFGVAMPDLSTFDRRGPAYVDVDVPDNPIEAADLRRVLFQDRIPLWTYEKLYVPLDLEKIIESALPEEEIVSRDRSNNRQGWLIEHGGELGDYAFFPIHSRYRQALLGIRRSDARIVDILDVTPPLNLSG